MYINQDQSLDHYLGGYDRNLGATFYKIEDLVKAIVSECFDLVKSVGLNLGSVVETVAENLAAKLVAKGIKNVDELKGVTNTYDLAQAMTNEIFDYLTDVVQVLTPWDGEGDEPTIWWNSQADEGSMLVETAKELVLGRINALINEAIQSSGLDVHESTDDQPISDSDGSQVHTGIILIPGKAKHAKNQPTYHGPVTGGSDGKMGIALPMAIGGAALLYFML